MDWILSLSAAARADRDRVGGKALNLGLLVCAGFPVPRGFCVTTDAFETTGDDHLHLRPEARAHILRARESLGSVPVAVRSSAVAEDQAGASFAGQHLTLLNVEGGEALIDAVERCAASVFAVQAQAYRDRRRVADASGHPAAVVVQEMAEAECAGVVFTADPVSGSRSTLTIEAVPGLGEKLVGGEVTPDRFVVERESRRILSADPARADGVPVFSEQGVNSLVEAACRIEDLFGVPQDIEWAWAGSGLAILQARPVTVFGDADADSAALRRTEVERLRSLADREGTVWSGHNLAETLAAPTPMTWSILGPFLSGRGGLGLAYRDLGFHPSERIDREGFIDLVCGRPYYNLSREAELHFAGFPFEYPFSVLRADPTKASYARPEVNVRRAGPGFLLKLPLFCWQMLRAELRQARLLRTFHTRLLHEIHPPFREWVSAERARALSDLADDDLLPTLAQRVVRTLDTFGREALKGTLLAGRALTAFEAFIGRAAPSARPLVPGILRCPEHDPNLEAERRLCELGRGNLTLDVFLDAFGHRAAGELELSVPRWRETPQVVEGMAAAAASHPPPSRSVSKADAEERQRQFLESVPEGQRHRAEELLAVTLTYLRFREGGKFMLMLGYELIRTGLVEIGRRWGLGDDVFFLEIDELGDVVRGADLASVAQERRHRRDALLRIPVPAVLFSDDLDAIGRPLSIGVAGEPLAGTPVSPGVAEGPALVVSDPTTVPPEEAGYVLVCAAADPGWTPILARASAIVLERGGILSHSAIVAREFGIPAITNVPHATRRIHAGDRVCVDGVSGQLTVGLSPAGSAQAAGRQAGTGCVPSHRC